jgi:hypothetical protein
VIARVLGLLATLAGLAAFVPLAGIRADLGGAGGVPQGVAELVLGSVLMGAIWVGMILGHWYLVERRLSNRYMVQIAWVNVAAIGAGLALGPALGPQPGARARTCPRVPPSCSAPRRSRRSCGSAR